MGGKLWEGKNLGTLIEDDYFNKVCADTTQCHLYICSSKGCCPPPRMAVKRVRSLPRNVCPVSRQKEEGPREFLLYLLLLSCLQLKTILPMWHVLEWHVLSPSVMNHINGSDPTAQMKIINQISCLKIHGYYGMELGCDPRFVQLQMLLLSFYYGDLCPEVYTQQTFHECQETRGSLILACTFSLNFSNPLPLIYWESCSLTSLLMGCGPIANLSGPVCNELNFCIFQGTVIQSDTR